MQEELTEKELIECLEIPNVPVIQHTMLKLIKNNIKSDYIRDKLIQYEKFMDIQFKILGFCKIGHLAIYTLKELGYTREFQMAYDKLEKEDKEIINILEKSF
jgi:hypothetical protein